MTEIVSLRVPDFIDSDCYSLLLSKISKEKNARIGRYHRISDAYRSLLGELLLRATICDYTGMSNDDISFVYNNYGKPSLTRDKGSPFSFNLSHSGNWVVLICSDKHLALGIDVEEIKPMNMEIAESFFCPQEYIDLIAKQGEEQLEYFFRLWTLKESYVKALGKGLSIPLDGFSLSHQSGDVWFSPEASNFHFKSFDMDEQHIISACSESDDLPNNIREITFEDLCHYFEGKNCGK